MKKTISAAEAATSPEDAPNLAAKASDGRPSRAGWSSLRFLLTGSGLLAGGIGVASLAFAGDKPTMLLVTACSFVCAYLTLRGLARGVSEMQRGKRWGSVLSTLLNGVVFFISAISTAFLVLSASGMTRGRQLRRRGKVLLPRLDGEDDKWSSTELSPEVEPSMRAALAAQWRENGRTEHASVGAFAHLVLDLMALGAPSDLVAAANRDSLDEIRHAELCFSLARALDGQVLRPGAFPEAQAVRTLPAQRQAALMKLAVDSLIDGALYEGVSARVISKLARRCEDAAIRAILKEIAADEWRHAAHGWEVVHWCIDTGGDAVVQALHGALTSLPKNMHTALPEAAAAGAWERYGIHGHALEAEEYARTRQDLVRRVLALGEAAALAA